MPLRKRPAHKKKRSQANSHCKTKKTTGSNMFSFFYQHILESYLRLCVACDILHENSRMRFNRKSQTEHPGPDYFCRRLQGQQCSHHLQTNQRNITWEALRSCDQVVLPTRRDNMEKDNANNYANWVLRMIPFRIWRLHRAGTVTKHGGYPLALLSLAIL